MEMKVNAPLLKQSREDRGWSQEHLAAITGLSVRTIQRVETSGIASAETKMALASALELDIARLGQPAPAEPFTQKIQIPVAGAGDGTVIRHAILYVVICGSLIVADVSRHGGITWSKWPALGWGLGLLLHFLKRRWPKPA